MPALSINPNFPSTDTFARPSENEFQSNSKKFSSASSQGFIAIFPFLSTKPHLSSMHTFARPSLKQYAVSNSGLIITSPLLFIKPYLPLSSGAIPKAAGIGRLTDNPAPSTRAFLRNSLLLSIFPPEITLLASFYTPSVPLLDTDLKRFCAMGL